MSFRYSEHAQKRLQQRAIPPFILELLETCGTAQRCGEAEKLVFDKAARKRLKHHLGGARNLKIIEPWLSVYAVIGDNGTVITAARYTKRGRQN